MLVRREMFKERFEALAIHLEGVSIVRIFNLHGSVWVNHLNDEWASPTRAELSKKHMQTGALQQYFLIGFESFLGNRFVME